ncbi:hypothetical protein GCM10027059_36680 [Myceligenerans halotolerans]
MSNERRVRIPALRPGPSVSLRLLGSFVLEVDHQPVTLPAGAQRLVALLALRGRTGRSRLAGQLWPETVEQRALACLRTGIWRVNQAARGLVVATHGTVELDSVDIDVTRLVRRAQDLLSTDDVDPTFLDDPASDLLQDWDEEWLDAERERLHQLRLHVLEESARRLADQRRYGLALDAALAAVRADELRESAHRTVIAIHLAEGNLCEARRAYQVLARNLRAELGIEPSPSVQAMIGA